MFCSQCGSPLVDGAAFCTNCGAKVMSSNDVDEVKASVTDPFPDEAPGYPEEPQEESVFTDPPLDDPAFDQTQQVPPAYNNMQQQEYQQQGYQQNYNEQGYSQVNSRAAGIVGYITWIGFIVAIVIGDRRDPFTRFHTNQALVLNIAAIISGIIMLIPIIGIVLGIIGYILVIIGWFIGIISAASGTMKSAPLFGKINLIG